MNVERQMAVGNRHRSEKMRLVVVLELLLLHVENQETWCSQQAQVHKFIRPHETAAHQLDNNVSSPLRLRCCAKSAEKRPGVYPQRKAKHTAYANVEMKGLHQPATQVQTHFCTPALTTLLFFFLIMTRRISILFALLRLHCCAKYAESSSLRRVFL